MKRFIVQLLLIGVITCMAVGYFLRVNITSANDITLENIEALASGEGQSGFCYGKGTVNRNGQYVEFKIEMR